MRPRRSGPSRDVCGGHVATSDPYAAVWRNGSRTPAVPRERAGCTNRQPIDTAPAWLAHCSVELREVVAESAEFLVEGLTYSGGSGRVSIRAPLDVVRHLQPEEEVCDEVAVHPGPPGDDVADEALT